MLDFHILARIGGVPYLCNFRGIQGADMTATIYDQTQAISAAVTDCLTVMREANWGEHEIESALSALGVAVSDLANWREMEEEGKITADENEFRTRFAAMQMEGVLENRGAVSTIEILQAKEPQLEEWAEWYESEARDLWRQMVAIEAASDKHVEHQGWCSLRAKFERAAWLYWQCARRLGRA